MDLALPAEPAEQRAGGDVGNRGDPARAVGVRYRGQGSRERRPVRAGSVVLPQRPRGLPAGPAGIVDQRVPNECRPPVREVGGDGQPLSTTRFVKGPEPGSVLEVAGGELRVVQDNPVVRPRTAWSAWSVSGSGWAGGWRTTHRAPAGQEVMRRLVKPSRMRDSYAACTSSGTSCSMANPSFGYSMTR